MSASAVRTRVTRRRSHWDLAQLGPPSDVEVGVGLGPLVGDAVRDVVIDPVRFITFVVPMIVRRNLAGMAVLFARLAPTHPHRHGPKSAVGNMLAGPFVAMVDRAATRSSKKRARGQGKPREWLASVGLPSVEAGEPAHRQRATRPEEEPWPIC